MVKNAHKISLMGGLIFTALTVATGLSVYFVMLKKPDDVLMLQSLAQDRAMLIERDIHKGIIDTQSQIINPPLLLNLHQLNNNPDDAEELNDLQRLLTTQLMEANFTGISIYSSQGNQLIRAGHFSENKDNAVIPFNTTVANIFLLWEKGFILRTHIDLTDRNGHLIGSIETERNLPQFTSIFLKTEEIGSSGQISVCAPWGSGQQEMICFMTLPNNSSTVEFKHLPRVIEDVSLPMDYTVNRGRSIVNGIKDYRQIPIAGVYSPINKVNSGLVLKFDEKGIHKLITRDLSLVVLSILLLIIVGILLLYWLVRPLVQKLLKSEQELRKRLTEDACLYSIRKILLSHTSVKEVCQHIIAQLATAVQFPQVTAIKLEINGKEFVCGSYRSDFTHGLQAGIQVKDKKNGTLQVYYSEKKSFLPEEQHLVNLIADDLGRWLELIEAEKAINHSADHDELTGLPNRRLLLDRITQILAQCSRNHTQTAALFIDLDNFKNINDSLGHAIGDLLLKEVAARLMSCIRAEDTVARQRWG